MPLMDGTGPGRRSAEHGCECERHGKGEGGCRSIATADRQTLESLADRLQRRFDAVRKRLARVPKAASRRTINAPD